MLNWVGAELSNTTLCECDLDVSCVSPGSAPRVLGKDVVNTIFSTVSNSKDTMVDFVTTSSGDNTIFVVSENILVTLDADRDWSKVKSSLKLRWFTLLDLMHGFDLSDTL